MTASERARDGDRPRLLAVTGKAPWPVRGGFPLRAAGLLEALAGRWDIDLVVAGPVDEGAVPTARGSRAGSLLGSVTAVPEAEPWQAVPSLRRDHRALREAVDRVVADREPDAALLFNGTEFLAFDRPDFPGAVADRIDCATLERHRFIRYARYLRIFKAMVESREAKRYERRVVRELPATTVVGEDDAGALQRLAGRESVYVVLNGVETLDTPEFERESDRPTVVFSGTLRYYANADAVLWFARGIWPLIRDRVPGARFVVAGRDPGRRVRALASRPGIEVRPDVPDMRRVLQESWVCVAPMRCGAGVKNKVLEGWAVGRPAVLSPLGSNGLHIDQTARSLIASGPQGFADRVVELLLDRDRRHAAGEAAQAIARTRHSWSLSATMMNDVLDRVRRQGALAGAPSPAAL